MIAEYHAGGAASIRGSGDAKMNGSSYNNEYDSTTGGTMDRCLFLDDRFIARLDGVRREPHSAVRYAENPLLTRRYPWEGARLQLYGRSIIYNRELERFQMFYMAQPNPGHWPNVTVGGQRKVGLVTLPAYAESDDGIKWERPLGFGERFEETTATNLLDVHDGTSFEAGVLYDPIDPDPNRRLKALIWDQHFDLPCDGTLRYEPAGKGYNKMIIDSGGKVVYEQIYDDWGMRVAFSRDGRHWEKRPGWVLPCYSDTGQSPIYDPRIGRYVAFGRFNRAPLPYGDAEFVIGRSVARIESEDFEHWSYPELILGADNRDPEAFQINSMPADLYEGLYVGLLETDIRRPGVQHAERMGMQLAVSRDGRHWTRVADRFVFLGRQEDPEAWDQGAPTDWVRPATGLHVVDNQVRFYYNSGPLTDGCSGIGMAFWRRDGFVSITADADGGELLTRSFIVDGERLHLNVDATRGNVSVELCDHQGRSSRAGPPTGRSKPVGGDCPDVTVDWQGGGNLRELMGRPITLRIRLENAHLYSFWTE